MLDLIGYALAAFLTLAAPSPEPAPVPDTTAPTQLADEQPEDSPVEDEADGEDPTEIDPDEEVISEEENAANVAATCAEWLSPGHGSWGDEEPLDPEYVADMDTFCSTPLDVTAIDPEAGTP